MTSAEVYCSLPFASISIDGPGRTRVCCNNVAHWNDPDAQRIDACHKPLDAINSSIHKDIRLAISQGRRHDSCRKCWALEDMGTRSFRQIWNDALGLHDLKTSLAPDGSLENHAIKYLDITLGNKCNLVCRMCNWANSHLWIIDDQRLGRQREIEPSLLDQTWFEVQGNLELLGSALSDVTHINFLGGEPLIVRSHIKLLQKAIDLGVAPNISLSYNTNLTHLDDSYLNTWHSFKQVRVNVSLEAASEANDYIRQNSNWSRIQTNIDLLLAAGGPIQVDIHATFGIYNALLIPGLMRYSCTRIGIIPWLNVVTHPSNQDTRHLPNICKQLVSDGILNQLAALSPICSQDRHDIYHGAITHMNQPGDPQKWLDFWRDAGEIDALKERMLRDHLPALWMHHP